MTILTIYLYSCPAKCPVAAPHFPHASRRLCPPSYGGLIHPAKSIVSNLCSLNSSYLQPPHSSLCLSTEDSSTSCAQTLLIQEQRTETRTPPDLCHSPAFNFYLPSFQSQVSGWTMSTSSQGCCFWFIMLTMWPQHARKLAKLSKDLYAPFLWTALTCILASWKSELCPSSWTMLSCALLCGQACTVFLLRGQL